MNQQTNKREKKNRKKKRSGMFNYSMFHVTWTTFKFDRNQLGTVSAYVMSSVPLSNQRAH